MTAVGISRWQKNMHCFIIWIASYWRNLSTKRYLNMAHMTMSSFLKHKPLPDPSSASGLAWEGRDGPHCLLRPCSVQAPALSRPLRQAPGVCTSTSSAELCVGLGTMWHRPDVPGYADKLEGDPSTGSGRAVWCCPSTSSGTRMRPGITGPATLKYRLEDEMLASLRLSPEGKSYRLARKGV